MHETPPLLSALLIKLRRTFLEDIVTKRNNSPLEDFIEVMAFAFRYIPPWISLPLAIFAFFAISTWFDHKFKTPALQNFGNLFGGVAAVAILAGGIGGWLYRKRQAAFLKQNITLDWINSLSWQEFETLAGEIFRARGFSVEHIGGGGADGGIDLRLRRQGETTLVQCKRWKVFKVGVKPVREFFGVMTSEGVARGIFVSSGVYTNEALRFAERKPLELIDGAQFAEMAKSFQAHTGANDTPLTATFLPDTTPVRPACPTCGKSMVLRRAKTGKNIGQEFWGCSGFPQCRGTRSAT